MGFKVGDKFPANIEFNYVPIDTNLKDQDPLACTRPIKLKLDELIRVNANSNILIVSVPGAFTPTCTESHVPPILQNLGRLKSEKNISVVIIISANDAFVLNAWGKLLISNINFDGNSPKLIFASDPTAQFSHENDLSVNATANGMGIRTARYALLIDSERTVKYLGKETGPGVNVSGLENILSAKL